MTKLEFIAEVKTKDPTKKIKNIFMKWNSPFSIFIPVTRRVSTFLYPLLVEYFVFLYPLLVEY